MEPDKKDTLVICVLVYILLLTQGVSVARAEELQLPKDFKVSRYFSFFGSRGIDWRALHDPNNNPILVDCIEGCTEESLKALEIADLQQRLERLERGNLIRKSGERYTLAFPAIIGEERDRLRKYAEQAGRELVPLCEKMIARLRASLAGRDEMLYHVMWSVVMDGEPAWVAARAEMNKQIKSGDTSIYNKAWLLYPSHPFRAGTNSSKNSFGQLRVTWSRNTPSPDPISRVIGQYAGRLTEAIENNSALTSADARNALGKYGLVDEAGKVRLYTIKPGSEAANVYRDLGGQFGRQMMDHLDVARVVDMLGVSPGIAFVIAYHEISWQLLQDLSEKKILDLYRPVDKTGTDASEAYRLVSLTIVPRTRDPFLETEMSKEEAQAIEEFYKIRKKVLAGEKYEDCSTPLKAFLSILSALHSRDAEAAKRICAVDTDKMGLSVTNEFMAGWEQQLLQFDILRAPLPPEQPEEGTFCPIYVKKVNENELADTLIPAFWKGKWLWVGNVGNKGNWRDNISGLKDILKKFGK
jgi:hypothetical protein